MLLFGNNFKKNKSFPKFPESTGIILAPERTSLSLCLQVQVY